MNKYIPLHVHSYYSLLDGLSKPKDILDRINTIECDACAITDHGSISSHINMLQTFKEGNKKILLGCELYSCYDDPSIQKDTNKKLAHLCVIAKNDKGWRDLVQLVSESNKPEFFYYRPRLDLNRIAQYASNGNLMAFSGHLGSHIANAILDEDGNVSSMAMPEATKLACWFRDTFGKDNFFLEVQLMDSVSTNKQKVVSDIVRKISKDTGIPCVATPDAHYASQKDAEDQRVLICTNLNTTIQQASKPEFGMNAFFRSRQFHIPSHEEMKQWHTDEELDNTVLFASRVEEYKEILKQPILPNFDCPNGQDQTKYFRHLCEEGFRSKIKKDESTYRDRLEHELKVLEDANLSGYFLVVNDVLNFARQNKWMVGPGRGSAAGCLASYLIGITDVDPIRYKLIFERFYNAGRNTKDRVSMPDIDIDVPAYSREKIIDYLRTKYGKEYVGQMVTFHTLKGRSAIKAVLRAYGGMPFEEMNQITKNIIEEHKIADELQKMKDATGESSAILWCLEHMGSKFKDWCVLNSDDTLSGPLASRFEQAIRLEGVKTTQSKHASGIVITPEPLSNICPMIYDSNSKQQIAGFEMEQLESVGAIKFDILGLSTLDKSMGICQDLLGGEIREI